MAHGNLDASTLPGVRRLSNGSAIVEGEPPPSVKESFRAIKLSATSWRKERASSLLARVLGVSWIGGYRWELLVLPKRL